MNIDKFRSALNQTLTGAGKLGVVAVDVHAGELHRRVGGYPGSDHRLAVCCNVMRSFMQEGDELVTEPKRGVGANVVIRYKLPRAINCSVV